MVNININLENREKLKRLHTATHLLNYSAKEILGNHVWQNGSNLKAEIGSLDITHYQNLTLDEIFLIERKVNRFIFENKNVQIEEIDRTLAERKYGFTLYQGGAIPMKILRVVKITNSDIEACGGLHMESTGGIGFFKIVNSQKIQDGVVRIKFVVNDYAIKLVETKDEILKNISTVYSVEESSLVKTSQIFFNEWKSQKKEIDSLKTTLKNTYLKNILNSKINEFDLEISYDMGFLMDLFNEIKVKKKSFKLISDKFIIATIDFKEIKSKKIIDKKTFKIYIL